MLFASLLLIFQVHFVHLKNDIGVSPEKCHLLTDVIQNLELDGSCYVKRTFKVYYHSLTLFKCTHVLCDCPYAQSVLCPSGVASRKCQDV